MTDSERFYTSVLDLFEDPDEIEEVNELMVWWNRCIHIINTSIPVQANIQ